MPLEYIASSYLPGTTMRVFVTGSSSCLAAALLPKLCARPDITEVIGIDLRPASFAHAKFRASVLSIAAPTLRDEMHGCDAVIHLAFAVMRGKLTDAEQRINNIEGSLKVFEDAMSLGIQKVINMSSVSAYGRGLNISEISPLAPSKLFVYAQHKAEIESICSARFPNVIHLRSHLIFGKNAQRFLVDMVNAPVYIATKRPAPVMQVIHEQDVADAILKALDCDVSGAYNLAAPEIVSLPQLVKHGRKMVCPLPLGLVKRVVSAAEWLGSKEEFTWLEVIDTTLTVTCERARKDLNWTPQFSAWEARAEMRKSS